MGYKSVDMARAFDLPECTVRATIKSIYQAPTVYPNQDAEDPICFPIVINGPSYVLYEKIHESLTYK